MNAIDNCAGGGAGSRMWHWLLVGRGASREERGSLFCSDAERTRMRVPFGAAEAWVLSAEAIAVFKLLFFRDKDIVVLERLVAVQRDRLDCPYVRRWPVDTMGEEDDRAKRWDDTVLQLG